MLKSIHRSFPNFIPNFSDGNKNTNYGGNSCTHTAGTNPGDWWVVDLQAVYMVTSVSITNRLHG